MKTNNIKYIIFFLLIFSLLNSCDLFRKKEIKPVSEISTFPIFFFNEGKTVVHTIGEAWEEPGVLVSEVKAGENDLSSTLVIDDSEMDINNRGLYTIKYTATNSYGYSKTEKRFVLVTSELSNLYDISGTYYQGFFPTDQNTMTITPSEVTGFWNVSKIRDNSKPIEGFIADLGDLNYIVAPALLTRKISNLKYVYLSGRSEFNEAASPQTMTFFLTQVYEDGEELAGEQEFTWKKVAK